MGRAIRKVPPRWEHPRYTAEEERAYGKHDVAGEYKPLFESDYDTIKAEWIAGLIAWESGERPSYASAEDREWWDWEGGPPKREKYVPYKEIEATWFQMYETVSEGTPLSPPFATQAELVDWLVANKDFWGYGPRTREVAERFVNTGWAPSMIVSNTASGVVVGDGIEMLQRIADGTA